jgi:DNA-dependent RNA polymerase auxiliary subunit epsilon
MKSYEVFYEKTVKVVAYIDAESKAEARKKCNDSDYNSEDEIDVLDIEINKIVEIKD